MKNSIAVGLAAVVLVIAGLALVQNYAYASGMTYVNASSHAEAEKKIFDILPPHLVQFKPHLGFLEIDTNSSWSGNIGVLGVSKSIQGDGQATNGLPCMPGDIYSVVIQKRDSLPGELSARVVLHGQVLKELSTDADYGVVSLSGVCPS